MSAVYFTEIKESGRALLGLPNLADRAHTGGQRTAERTATISQVGAERTAVLRASSYGHYYADAEINGRRVAVMVDTGASHVAMSYEDARRAGIHVRDSDFTQLVRTANGMARVAPVTLDRISIGDVTVRDVPASVSERGTLGTTLLGMSFLKRLRRVDMRGDTLLLQE